MRTSSCWQTACQCSSAYNSNRRAPTRHSGFQQGTMKADSTKPLRLAPGALDGVMALNRRIHREAGFKRYAAGDGEVGLADAAVLELHVKRRRCLLVLRHNQHACTGDNQS